MYPSHGVADRTTKRDVGSSSGTSWTLSSYKPGSGVAELRSPDLTKLWQSDGNQPHLINIQFARRTCVSHISVYLDVKQDDSYTPTRIAIKAGTNYHDLTLVRQRSFDSPQGWKHFNMTPGSVDASTNEEDETQQEEEVEEDEEEDEEPEDGGIRSGMDADDDAEEGEDDQDDGEGIKVWLLQVCILANHLNGKDTHIRRLIVFGPQSSSTSAANSMARSSVYNRLKRELHTAPSEIMPAAKNRATLTSSHTGTGTGISPNLSRGGQNVTLAQLLAIQTQAAASLEADGEAEDDGITGSTTAAAPTNRSGLNLFGNIR